MIESCLIKIPEEGLGWDQLDTAAFYFYNVQPTDAVAKMLTEVDRLWDTYVLDLEINYEKSVAYFYRQVPGEEYVTQLLALDIALTFKTKQ
ncbi:hypothetical protein [Vibrio phage JSF12]|uniref:Uncharacterized protein n=2 Tax=Jesfedecavirus TaxID=2560156 RepID=A0A2D0Z670_9CAUD|nr:hypothetical protein FDI98_gp117 [Vibrio phage JSF10]YP_009794697.1 hypothetical protein HOS35_gp014 [Vibrio phage JSF12]ASV43415.1 hypothetical protein [Vibrio phage JSF10]ASV43532.1 hypothetical protein [Vibrio phage JSF12]